MRQLLLSLCIVVGVPSLVWAQTSPGGMDALGAHLNGGRGCNACHAGHTGFAGNGANAADNSSGAATALWGPDVSGLYGKTIATGGGQYAETLPTSMSALTPDVQGMLTCLSCHDGNYASASMMKNKIYETLPATYGHYNTIPTLFGTRESNYISQHPVGMNARVSCGGATGWDCTESNGVISMNGPMSSKFVRHYGFFVAPGVYNNASVVVCTTCHEPHSMRAVTITSNSNSGLPPGTYPTMFFLRAPYNPNNTNPNSNSTSQFCRQCHADKSNEMNGSSAGTVI
jgi:cytochrome c553